MTTLLLLALAGLAAVHFATLGIAVHRVWAARRTDREVRGDLPPVSLIRPVCGLENGIAESLISGFALDHPEYEIVFCVEEADDAAIPLVERLIAEHPRVPARILVGDERIGINPKLNNLVKGYAAARHDLLMMVDSNVVMVPGAIRHCLSEWCGEIGAVSAPGIGSAPEGAWGELECAFLNTYQARWLHAADRIGLGYSQGKMMLFRRSDLERAGGIGVLADEVAEDSGLTKAMRRLGRKVRMTGCQFLHPVGRRSFAAVWGRQLRWAKLRRACFPALYALEIGACPLVPLGLSAAVVATGALSPAWIALLALALYGAEAVLAAAARWRLAPLSPLLWILRDLLIPLIWVLGWLPGRFTWRGHGMQIDVGLPSGEVAEELYRPGVEADTGRRR